MAFENTDGTWLTLGVVGALAAAGAARGSLSHKRVLATFIPQKKEPWSRGGGTFDLGAGEYTFDITDQLLAMGKDKALEVESDEISSDHLWREHPVSTQRPHDGPFRVMVPEDEIAELFDA